ncbi:TlpA family protein disulfide reductase [Parasulfuritortus cantonensis]|uniref:TlpA family protein disulfide reductase n=1 Tax=Parasulfuritortus cantonensis TaxID=2528202 RepID=A0A4R1B4C3_9PROT|nr:TlpA disulfide reductase family protein [Parasulfuritortus cantonensis]TCJ12942.1 TlpA family protein disulfide reductase [Parasulfuritortus cantonensis]
MTALLRCAAAAALCLLTALPAAAGGLKPLTPRPAPALKLASLAGPAIDLASLRGKVVLVNFWATWCPPCRKEIPSMNRLAARMAGRPFAILGVNMGDNPADIRAYTQQVPIEFAILPDPDGNLLKPWQVVAFPTSYVVDKQGRIRLGLFGSIEWDSPEAVAELERLLAEPD